MSSKSNLYHISIPKWDEHNSQNESHVYFVLQREIGFSKWNLKIGHAKNPKTRFYSYRGIYNEAYLIHTIPVCSKKLACELERGFLRILKGQFKKEELFYDVREWVPFNDSIKPILKKWGVAHEMV